MLLKGKIALVTGASRGIGRGVALQLGAAGATVYVTGRQPSKKPSSLSSELPALEEVAHEISKRGGIGIAVYCDHSDPQDVKRLFHQIETEHTHLDILINNAFSAIQTLTNAMGKPFWELDPMFWDEVNNVGLRNHYICSVYAAKLMVPRKTGLIVNISSAGGLNYMFNMAYGVGKEGCDRMAVDGAHELRDHNVAFVSLWPGVAKTELTTDFFKSSQSASQAPALKHMFDEGETPEYIGKCVVHLAADLNLMKLSGKVLFTGDLGEHYGFVDLDGHKPKSLRCLKSVLEFSNYTRIAAWIPEWIKLPGWMVSMGANRF